MLQTLQKEYETSESAGICNCNIVADGCIHKRRIGCVCAFVKIIIIIKLLLKFKYGAFCKVELAKCTFFAFFCEKIWWFQKKAVSLHRKTNNNKILKT